MNNEPKKWAVMFVGPPGSGKDTQADLISQELGLVNVKTSQILENAFNNADPSDPSMAHEKELFDSGQLNSFEFVIQCLLRELRSLAEKGKGVALSGSPRRIAEAEGEMPTIEELYGKDNIKVINITLSEKESINRNSTRRICELNHHPILNTPENKTLTACPKDGSPIIQRGIDDPETIKIRYTTFISETAPLIDFLSKKGYKVIAVNGEQSIEELHREILNKLW